MVVSWWFHANIEAETCKNLSLAIPTGHQLAKNLSLSPKPVRS